MHMVKLFMYTLLALFYFPSLSPLEILEVCDHVYSHVTIHFTDEVSIAIGIAKRKCYWIPAALFEYSEISCTGCRTMLS